MPELSIVIINYNTFSITSDCLRSIYKYTKELTFEIILVDNGSKDRAAKEFLIDFPEIKLIALPENVGFARGNNAGIEAALAPVILLLNSDTLIFDNSIKATFDFLNKKEDVGLVGCRLLNKDGSEQLSTYITVKHPLFNLLVTVNLFVRIIASVFPSLKFYTKHLAAVSEAQKESHYCEAVSGAFMMFKNSELSRYGHFDPDFFLYCEETEWCRNRVLKHTKIYYYNEASIIHIAGQSSQNDIIQKQILLSSFLYTYKINLYYYWSSIIIYAISCPMNLFFLPFMKRINAKREFKIVKYFPSIIPYLFFEIPRYSRKYGSRPQPLIIKELKSYIK